MASHTQNYLFTTLWLMLTFYFYCKIAYFVKRILSSFGVPWSNPSYLPPFSDLQSNPKTQSVTLSFLNSEYRCWFYKDSSVFHKIRFRHACVWLSRSTLILELTSHFGRQHNLTKYRFRWHLRHFHQLKLCFWCIVGVFSTTTTTVVHFCMCAFRRL